MDRTRPTTLLAHWSCGLALGIITIFMAQGHALAQATRTQRDGRGELPPLDPSQSSPLRSKVEPSMRLSISGLPEGFDLRRPDVGSFREGQVVSRLLGTIRRTTSDDYIFIPDGGGTQTLEDAPLSPPAPPMVLLPCQRLAQVASGVQSRGGAGGGTGAGGVGGGGRARDLDDGTPPMTAQAWVSGLLYSYRGRAFLLPTAIAFADEPADDAARGASHDGAKPDNNKTMTSAAAPTAPMINAKAPSEDIAVVIKDLEQAWSTRRTLSRPQRNDSDRELLNSPANDDGSDAPRPMLLPERTVLSQVRGRLVRLAEAEGRFAFALDNDPNSPNPAAAPEPLLLLPSRQLEQIEDAVAQLGDNTAFTLTGRVYEYRGNRYLLPIAFQVESATDIKPAQ